MSVQLTRTRLLVIWVISCIVVLQSLQAFAKPPTQVKSVVNRSENPDRIGETLVLPFAFSAESTDLVFGVGGMRKGFYQDQMLIGGAAYAGEESYGAFGGVWDYRFPWSRRLFLSATGMIGFCARRAVRTKPRAPSHCRRYASSGADSASLAPHGYTRTS